MPLGSSKELSIAGLPSDNNPSWMEMFFIYLTRISTLAKDEIVFFLPTLRSDRVKHQASNFCWENIYLILISQSQKFDQLNLTWYSGNIWHSYFEFNAIWSFWLCVPFIFLWIDYLPSNVWSHHTSSCGVSPSRQIRGGVIINKYEVLIDAYMQS